MGRRALGERDRFASLDGSLRDVTVARAALLLGWFAFPLVCAVALTFVGSRYILQETGWLLWGLGTGGLWLAVTLVILPGLAAALLRAPKEAFAFVGWAALTGWYAGMLAIRLVDCVGDGSDASPAVIAKIGRAGRMTEVTIGEPYPGTAFSCPHTTWLAGEASGKRFFVHRGRLGLLWGELR